MERIFWGTFLALIVGLGAVALKSGSRVALVDDSDPIKGVAGCALRDFLCPQTMDYAPALKVGDEVLYMRPSGLAAPMTRKLLTDPVYRDLGEIQVRGEVVERDGRKVVIVENIRRG